MLLPYRSRTILVRLTATRSGRVRPFGHRLTAVLSRGDEPNADREAVHAALAKLSTNSRHSIVAGAGHEIPVQTGDSRAGDQRRSHRFAREIEPSAASIAGTPPPRQIVAPQSVRPTCGLTMSRRVLRSGRVSFREASHCRLWRDPEHIHRPAESVRHACAERFLLLQTRLPPRR